MAAVAARMAILIPTLLTVVFSVTASGTAAGWMDAYMNKNTDKQKKLKTATIVIGALSIGAFCMMILFKQVQKMM